MPSTRNTLAITAAAAVAGAGIFALVQPVTAQAPSTTADVIGELAANEGIFVDGKTFKVVKGKAKSDPAAKIKEMGARELGPGAILIRYNDKLYVAEGTPMPAPQAMKSFQDEWAVGYMKAFKSFQDEWAVGYMKNPATPQVNASAAPPVSAKDAVGMEQYKIAMKNFQDEWSVGYMKAMKDFQDNWNVSYMKNFQDNWAVSYMNSVKNFQDTFSTMYMK